MILVTFLENKIEYDRNAFFQYDYGQQLGIIGLSLPEGTQFHFANKGRTAVTVLSTITQDETLGNITMVSVPQSVLEIAGEMNVYIYKASETAAKTFKAITFNVREREKPGNYAPPDNPNIVEILMAKLNQIIETGIAEYTPDPQLVRDIVEEEITENYITNNDAANIPGTAWDAVRGKAIRDDFTNFVAQKAVINGIASLDSSGKVPAGQLPIVNNGATTVEGTVLDGRMGKTLLDNYNNLNDNLTIATGILVAADNITITSQKLSRQGKDVYMQVVLNKTDLTAFTARTNLFTIPSGFTPSQTPTAFIAPGASTIDGNINRAISILLWGTGNVNIDILNGIVDLKQIYINKTFRIP